MDYINNETGEVFAVEDTTLANLCEGDVDMAFKAELKKLVATMNEGDKGAISIAIKLYKTRGVDNDICVAIETQIGTKYPKVTMKDDNPKRIDENGKLVQHVRINMFDGEQVKE